MKPYIKTSFLRTLLLSLLLALAVTSCVRSSEETPPGGQHRDITFQLTDDDEGNIETLDILAFRVDQNDNTKETFAYRARGRNITQTEVENTKKFTVSLIRDDQYQYRFVILADSRKEFEALGEIAPGTDKSTLMNSLISSHQGAWITDVNDPMYAPIPMWGQTDQMSITDQTSQISGIKLTRLLSRLDVTLDGQALESFILKSVRVYNYNTNGQIAPNTAPEYWDGSKALQPTIPDPDGKNFGPLVYRPTVENIAVIGEIYLYETLTSARDYPTTATCLIIGGEYNNEGVNSYYRVDIARKQGETVDYIDILRNHLYTVKITKIEGSGYSTPAEAYDAGSSNIQASLEIWDKAEFPNIVIDGQYLLAVSNDYFELPLNQRTHLDTDNRISITTNFPQGWRIDKIVNESDGLPTQWLTVNRYVGFPHVSTTVSILTDENITEVDRTSLIYIRAGKLVYIVRVTQTTLPEIGMDLNNSESEPINELFFGPHVDGIVPVQQLTVSWLPRDQRNFVSIVPVAGTSVFNFGAGDRITSGYILDAVDGSKTYNIQPPAFTQNEIDANPFLEKALRVDFTVSNGVTYESKVLFLVQKNFAAVPKSDISYIMDGSEQSFTINANAPWQIEVTSDPLNIIDQLITTQGGQYEDKRDETVSFATNNYLSNPDITSGEVTFTLKSTNAGRPFPDKIFTLKFYSGLVLNSSNTYVIKPSTILNRSYLIPISRANEAFAGSISDTDTFDASIVWTDNLNNASTLQLVTLGRGNSGYIYVYPGSELGNTVIAARVGGIVKWSWHLWHADFDPNQNTKTLGAYTLMDRNLGSQNNSLGNANSVGTYYQWGRKDPFPAASNNNVTTSKVIYNGSGQVLSIPTSTTGNTAQFTVQNPLTYLITGSTWNGSAGAQSWDNAGRKTIYDPCPEGWKVPPNTMWGLFNTGNLVWNGTSKGGSHSTAGWFPASGARARGSIAIVNNGTQGLYYSSTYASPYTQGLSFMSTTVTNLTNYYYTEGLAIRCIKE